MKQQRQDNLGVLDKNIPGPKRMKEFRGKYRLKLEMIQADGDHMSIKRSRGSPPTL